MSTWFFGASSDWSQRIITQLEGPVESFGRQANPSKYIKQVDYQPNAIKTFVDELELLPLPDTIIFNINTGPVTELPDDLSEIDYGHYEVYAGNTAFNSFNLWWDTNREQLFFKTYLSNWLTRKGYTGNICYITSQISADHNPDFKHLQMYKNLRALDYEIIWNNRNNNINAYGICPASNEVPMDWADYIVGKINTGDLGKEDVWLYGVSRLHAPGHYRNFTMVERKDWERV